MNNACSSFAVIVGLFLSLAAIEIAEARNRIALVIGNSKYGGNLELANPTNDADKMAEALDELGFEVIVEKDLDISAMDDALYKFAERIRPNSLAFFFFAGHGIQSKDVNYLIPIGADFREEHELKREAMSANLALDTMVAAGASIKVVVLDCCRNNPLARNWKTRSSATVGLAKMKGAEGTIIAYSTADNAVALDGQGDNSPYTLELARALSTRPSEGLELLDAFRIASREVKRRVDQSPFLYLDATIDDYMLVKGDGTQNGGDLAKVEQRIDTMRDAFEDMIAEMSKRNKEGGESVSIPDPASNSGMTPEMQEMLKNLMAQNQELMKKLEDSKESPPAPATGQSGTIDNTKTRSLDEELGKFIAIWESAWESQNMTAYRELYHSEFVGRNYSTRTGTKTMSYSTWMNDKQSKFSRGNSVYVGVSNISYQNFGDTVEVNFTQSYSSGGYSDKGQKTLTLKRGNNNKFTILREDFRP